VALSRILPEFEKLAGEKLTNVEVRWNGSSIGLQAQEASSYHQPPSLLRKMPERQLTFILQACADHSKLSVPAR
jgi:hypothetical protein